MVRTLKFLLVLLPLAVANATAAWSGELPESIVKGMTAYKETGADAAIQAWLAGSPMEGDEKALGQASILHQIEGFYGNFIGYEIIKEVDITTTSRLQYLQISYEKGPLFVYFLTYKKGAEWVVVNFKFHTEPDSIFPSQVVFK